MKTKLLRKIRKLYTLKIDREGYSQFDKHVVISLNKQNGDIGVYRKADYEYYGYSSPIVNFLINNRNKLGVSRETIFCHNLRLSQRKRQSHLKKHYSKLFKDEK